MSAIENLLNRYLFESKKREEARISNRDATRPSQEEYRVAASELKGGKASEIETAQLAMTCEMDTIFNIRFMDVYMG